MNGHKSIRIALVGAACTGKTTALHFARAAVGPRLPGYRLHFAEEIARQVIATRKISSPADPSVQQHILNAVLASEATFPEIDAIVSDRSLLDPIAYLTAMGEHARAADLTTRYWDQLSAIDQYLLFDPRGLDYREDSERHDGQQFRLRVHEGFLELLDCTRLPWVLVSGTRDERAASVLDCLQRLLNARGVQRRQAGEHTTPSHSIVTAEVQSRSVCRKLAQQ